MQGYAFYLSEPTDTSEFDALLPFVSIHRQELINRLRYQNDKIRSLVGDALTRLAIMKEIGLQNRDINFHYLKDQKPTLVHNASFHFSVSHSGNWIICCTDSQPIGVDIEKNTTHGSFVFIKPYLQRSRTSYSVDVIAFKAISVLL